MHPPWKITLLHYLPTATYSNNIGCNTVKTAVLDTTYPELEIQSIMFKPIGDGENCMQ